MSSIKVTNISKSIKKKKILNNINLDLKAGGIYGFYGRNGSGKTMLFRAISGLIIPDVGTIDVFGEQIGKDVSFPTDMGIIIENVGFWPNLTGYQNLQLLASIKKKIDNDIIDKTLERVGLSEDKHKKYGSYSLGMKQKLAIAQAIMEKPKLLILDEPTNSLDEQTVRIVHNIFKEEQVRGCTILICSHNKEDIKNLCDSIYIMDNGTCKILCEEFI